MSWWLHAWNGLAAAAVAAILIIIISRVCFNFTRENVYKHALIMFFVVCSFWIWVCRFAQKTTPAYPHPYQTACQNRASLLLCTCSSPCASTSGNSSPPCDVGPHTPRYTCNPSQPPHPWTSSIHHLIRGINQIAPSRSLYELMPHYLFILWTSLLLHLRESKNIQPCVQPVLNRFR